MHVLFLVDGDVHEPSARFRGYHLAAGLAAYGVEAEVLSASDRAGFAGKRRALRAAQRADVVVLQRVLPPRPALALLRSVNRSIVFDLDDALYALPSLQGRLTAMLGTATEVVVGNKEIARNVRAATRAVTVIPTVVDPASYPTAAPRSEAATLRLGWIGTEGNLPCLELVRPALRELAARGRALALRVICSAAPRWPELPIMLMRWQLGSATAALAELDVGLAPLPDTAWTRAKCGLKAIEYMAAALPVVASPVGALAEIVEHGTTGLLAATEREWVEHLDTLARDAELRRNLGSAGRRRIEERYSTAAALPALVAVLERAAASPRKRAA